MERPRFRRTKEQKTIQPAQFRITNEWNDTNPVIRIGLNSEALAELAKRDLGYTDDLIRRIDISLIDETADPEHTGHVAVDRNSNRLKIQLPLQHDLLRGLDMIERNRDQVEAVGNLVRFLTGNEDISIEDEGGSLPDPQFEQKKAVTTHLIAHLVEATYVLKSADIGRELRKVTRATNLGIAMSGSLAIENAVSGSMFNYAASVLWGYAALRLVDIKADVIKRSKGISLTDRDMQNALNNVNGNNPEDWVNLVTIEDTGRY